MALHTLLPEAFMYRRLAVGLMSVVLGGAAVLTASPAQATQPVQVQNVTLASTWPAPGIPPS
jgi:hypothetical protein